MKHRNNNNMYVVSCARILARCHIQIVYSRRQQPTDLPRNEMQAQLLLPLLLLVLPPLLLYLAACPSIWQRHCAGVRYSNDIWICAYTRILLDSLFILQGRQFVVALCRLIGQAIRSAMALCDDFIMHSQHEHEQQKQQQQQQMLQGSTWNSILSIFETRKLN